MQDQVPWSLTKLEPAPPLRQFQQFLSELQTLHLQVLTYGVETIPSLQQEQQLAPQVLLLQVHYMTEHL